MQEELLAKRPGADVRVYAIYFEIVHDDAGAKSRTDPTTLFADPRVSVFWDERRVAGRWFDEHVTKLGERQRQPDRIEWDAYILFDPEAKWRESETPPDVVSWGRTIYEERERLARDVDAALARAQKK